MLRIPSPFSRTRSNGFYLFLSALAVMVGGLIYILIRPTQSVFFKWIGISDPDHWLNPVRSMTTILGRLFPDWVVFSLPNGLWAFAYALIITRIWSGSPSWQRYLWMGSIPLIVLGFEILQYPGIIRGTFCMQDIILGASGAVIGILVGYSKTKNNNYYEKAFE
jgi:hypothetical protein